MYYAVLSYVGPYPAPYGFESWNAEVGDLVDHEAATIAWKDENYVPTQQKYYVVIVYGRE